MNTHYTLAVEKRTLGSYQNITSSSVCVCCVLESERENERGKKEIDRTHFYFKEREKEQHVYVRNERGKRDRKRWIEREK